jgi:hypothetical protein
MFYAVSGTDQKHIFPVTTITVIICGYVCYFKVEDGIYHLEAELNEKNVGRVADSVEKLCAEQFQNADCYVAVIPDKNYYLADKQYPTLDYERLDEMIQAEIPSAQKISLYGKLHLKDYYRTDLPALLCVLYRIADQVRPHFLKCIPAHKQHAVFRDTVCHL